MLKHPVGVTSLKPGIEMRWSCTYKSYIDLKLSFQVPFSPALFEPDIDTSFATEFFQRPQPSLAAFDFPEGHLWSAAARSVRFREKTPALGPIFAIAVSNTLLKLQWRRRFRSLRALAGP